MASEDAFTQPLEPSPLSLVTSSSSAYYAGGDVPHVPTEALHSYYGAYQGMENYGYSGSNAYVAGHDYAGTEYQEHAVAGYEKGNGYGGMEGTWYGGQVDEPGNGGYLEAAPAVSDDGPPELEGADDDDGPPGVNDIVDETEVEKNPPPPPGLDADEQTRASGAAGEASCAQGTAQAHAGHLNVPTEAQGDRPASREAPLHAAEERQLSPKKTDGRERSRSRSPARREVEDAEEPPPPPPEEDQWAGQYGPEASGYAAYGHTSTEYGTDASIYAAYSADPTGYGGYGAYGSSEMTQPATGWDQQSDWGGGRSHYTGSGYGGGGYQSQEMCRDFLAGRCHRGPHCRYSHGSTDPYNTQEVCRDFLAGHCVRPNCRYMHSGPPVCRDFTLGRCTRGSGCKFAHALEGPTAPPTDYPGSEAYGYS